MSRPKSTATKIRELALQLDAVEQRVLLLSAADELDWGKAMITKFRKQLVDAGIKPQEATRDDLEASRC